MRELCYLPLALDIPVAFNSCRRGPRALEWRSDKPAELCWIEAQVRISLAQPAQILKLVTNVPRTVRTVLEVEAVQRPVMCP